MGTTTTTTSNNSISNTKKRTTAKAKRNYDPMTMYQGILTIPNRNKKHNTIPLCTDHFLPKGYIIKNTDWILGVVLHTNNTSDNHHNQTNKKNKEQQKQK